MRESRSTVCLLFFATLATIPVHSIDGCPNELDPVKYRNGSIVYCNPDPEKYGPGDLFAQFPSCHPSQSCQYRWMGMYACCQVPIVARRSKTIPLIRGLQPSGYVTNGGGGPLPPPRQPPPRPFVGIPPGFENAGYEVGGGFPPSPRPDPSYPGPVRGGGFPSFPIPTSGPPQNPYGPPQFPTLPVPFPAPQPPPPNIWTGQTGYGYELQPAPPALIPSPPLPTPFVPIPVARPTPAVYNYGPPPLPPPRAPRPLPPPLPPVPTPYPAPRPLPTVIVPLPQPLPPPQPLPQAPVVGYGPQPTIALPPPPLPYGPPQNPTYVPPPPGAIGIIDQPEGFQLRPTFDPWEEAPNVPWMYETQLPPGFDVIRINCILRTGVLETQQAPIFDGYGSASPPQVIRQEIQPDLKYPPQGPVPPTFFRNRLPLCPQGVFILRTEQLREEARLGPVVDGFKARRRSRDGNAPLPRLPNKEKKNKPKKLMG